MTARQLLSMLLCLVLLALASVVVLAEPASASTTYTWKGDGDGHSWGVPGEESKNWDPQRSPNDDDSVVIEKNASIVVVPTISLASLAVSGDPSGGGPTLVGPTSTITTQLLNWTQGTIQASVV